jgi:putative hydrolase of the HAD superfamily
VLWPSEDGDNFYHRMADRLRIGRDRFTETWAELYDMRATGPIGPSVRAVCERLGISDEHVEGLISLRVDFTREVLVPRPGALDVLDELRRRGLRLGLISVCSEEVPVLWEQTALASRIDAAVFSCSVGLVKPNQRIYRLAADRLGVEPGRCLFVDDQPAFVEGALAAGMDAVLIGDNDFTGRRIGRLEEVVELLESPK